MAKMVFRATPVTPPAPPRRRFGRPAERGETARSWIESSWMLRDGLDVQEFDDDTTSPQPLDDGRPRRRAE